MTSHQLINFPLENHENLTEIDQGQAKPELTEISQGQVKQDILSTFNQK